MKKNDLTFFVFFKEEEKKLKGRERQSVEGTMFLPLPRLVKAEKPELTERVFTKLNPFYKSSQHIASWLPNYKKKEEQKKRI